MGRTLCKFHIGWNSTFVFICSLFLNIVFAPLFPSKFGIYSPEINALFPCSPKNPGRALHHCKPLPRCLPSGFGQVTTLKLKGLIALFPCSPKNPGRALHHCKPLPRCLPSGFGQVTTLKLKGLISIRRRTCFSDGPVSVTF